MSDYTWPSVYFAYFFFAICFGLAVFFFVRSWKDGYWSRGGEDVKYDVFREEPLAGRRGASGAEAALHDRTSRSIHLKEYLHDPR